MVYPTVKQQALKANASAEDVIALTDATHFGERVVEVVEQNIGPIEWICIKKEAHPAGPLVLAKPDDDVHYNVFGVMESKMTSISHDKLVVDDINYHLSEKDRRNVVAAPRLVSLLLVLHNFRVL